MAKQIGLGLQTVDRHDLVKDGDDVISGNALATKAAIDADRQRIAFMESAAGFENTVALTDEMVGPLVGDASTMTGSKLAALVASMTKLVSTLEELQLACSQGGIVSVVSDAPIVLSSPVVVSAPSKIVNGDFVLPANASGLGFHVKASGTSFDGSKFTGAGIAAGFLSARRFIYAEGTAETPIRGIKVRHCVMQGCQSENIRLAWARGCVVFDNEIDDFLYAGVMLISVDGVDVLSNKIRNGPLSAGVVNPYGIAATDSANTVAARSRRVRIIGNTVDGVQWEGIDTHGGDQIIIIGNHVLNCPRGIALVVGNDTRVAVPTNCVVQGNIVERGTAVGAAREGISIFGNATTGAKADAVITGNTIIGSFAPKIHRYETDPAKTVIDANTEPVGYAKGKFDTTANIAASGAAQYPVVFPVGRFQSPPNVMLATGHGRASAAALSVTKDGFTVNLNNWTPAAAGLFTVYWEATE